MKTTQQTMKLVASRLSLARRAQMNRWRVLNKKTGEVVEMSTQSFEGACHFLRWPISDCIGVYEGKQPIMNEPKRYVSPNLGPIKG